MLVTSLPVRTGTRAAGFRLLADIPGVRVIPDTKDPIGRVGTAVAISAPESPDHGIEEHRLVFDPRTSAALSNELRLLKAGPASGNLRSGSLLTGTVTQSVEWTAQRPPSYPGKSPGHR